MDKSYIFNFGNFDQFLHIFYPSPLLFQWSSRSEGSLLQRHSLDPPLRSFIGEYNVKDLTFTFLFGFDIFDRFLPRNIFLKQNNLPRRMHLLPFSKCLLNDSLSLDRPSKYSKNCYKKLRQTSVYN